VYSTLHSESETANGQIKRLKELLEEMRVLDLLEAAADSPDLAVLIDLNPAYEVRLLNYAGHPRASDEFPDLMRKVVANPTILAEAREKLDKAADVTLDAHRDIQQFILPPPQKSKTRGRAEQEAEQEAVKLGVDLSQVQGTGPRGRRTIEDVQKAAQAQADAAQTKKRKLFGGLGSLFSGLVLLGGDGAVPVLAAPVAGPLALPLIGSFAGGIAAVGKGIGDLRREGD
jgi:hypothetical protein